MTDSELEKVWESIRGKKLVHPRAKHGPWVCFTRLVLNTVFGSYCNGRLCVEFLQEVAKWEPYRSFEDQLEDL